jgi:hypothetical protein
LSDDAVAKGAIPKSVDISAEAGLNQSSYLSSAGTSSDGDDGKVAVVFSPDI